MATFTGDTWAVDATLAVPDAAVPRFIARSGEPVRWKVMPMSSGSDGAEQVADTDTSLSTCLVKISGTARAKALVSPLMATSGTIAAHEVTETDVSVGDVFVLAIPAATAGTADWLWIVPSANCTLLASGVSL